MPLVERGMSGVVDDIVTAGLELCGHARKGCRVASDLREPHGLDAREYAGDSLTLHLGTRQIAGRVRNEQHAELALLTACGIEARRHQVGCGVAPRNSTVERREPAADV